MSHAVRMWHRGVMTSFSAVLTGGRGVVDLNVHTAWLTASKCQDISAMTSKAADDLERVLSRVQRDTDA
jgi:hypothetical protein